MRNQVAQLPPEDQAAIGEQLDQIQRHIDYHLGKARVTGAAKILGVSTPVRARVEYICRAFSRLYPGKTVDLQVPANLAVGVEEQDFDEMVGNLLENAFKWSASQLRISSAELGGWITLRIEDDGPGMSEDQIAKAVLRGVRLDEKVPGSGLGLNIVSDLAEAYRGSLIMGRAELGGLAASLSVSFPDSLPASRRLLRASRACPVPGTPCSRGDPGPCDGGGSTPALVAATVLAEIPDDLGDHAEIRRVPDDPPLALARHEPRAAQLLEMERERRRGDVQLARDTAGRDPVAPSAHQAAEHVEPSLMGQGGEGREDVLFFHISIVIELLARAREVEAEKFRGAESARPGGSRTRSGFLVASRGVQPRHPRLLDLEVSVRPRALLPVRQARRSGTRGDRVDPLQDELRDLVGRDRERVRRARHQIADEGRLFAGIDQSEFDFVALVVHTGHEADDQIVRLRGSPGLELHLSEAGRSRGERPDRNGRVLAHRLEICADDLGDVVWRSRSARGDTEGHDGDRDRIRSRSRVRLREVPSGRRRTREAKGTEEQERSQVEIRHDRFLERGAELESASSAPRREVAIQAWTGSSSAS